VLLVAELDGAVAGFVACLVERYVGPEEAPDSAVYGLVSDIAVSPAARRRGVGQALLAAAEAHARGRGMARLRVNVLSANEEARAAYRRFGFVPYTEELEKRLR
jgi:ribosomal protein S18 acetylase RimI-like enzyme